MRRVVLVASTIFALTGSAFGQSENERMTVEQMPRPGGRVLFVHKPTTNNTQCPTIDASAITPQVAPRLGRTIFAEALVHSGNTVGYVYLILWAHGVYEVYFSSYTRRACAVTESQSHKRAFVTDNRFDEAKAYYHTLLNELTE